MTTLTTLTATLLTVCVMCCHIPTTTSSPLHETDAITLNRFNDLPDRTLLSSCSSVLEVILSGDPGFLTKVDDECDWTNCLPDDVAKRLPHFIKLIRSPNLNHELNMYYQELDALELLYLLTAADYLGLLTEPDGGPIVPAIEFVVARRFLQMLRRPIDNEFMTFMESAYALLSLDLWTEVMRIVVPSLKQEWQQALVDPTFELFIALIPEDALHVLLEGLCNITMQSKHPFKLLRYLLMILQKGFQSGPLFELASLLPDKIVNANDLDLYCEFLRFVLRPVTIDDKTPVHQLIITVINRMLHDLGHKNPCCRESSWLQLLDILQPYQTASELGLIIFSQALDIIDRLLDRTPSSYLEVFRRLARFVPPALFYVNSSSVDGYSHSTTLFERLLELSNKITPTGLSWSAFSRCILEFHLDGCGPVTINPDLQSRLESLLQSKTACHCDRTDIHWTHSQCRGWQVIHSEFSHLIAS